MKITSIMWSSYAPILKRAAEATGDELIIYSNWILEESPEKVDEALSSMRTSDVVLVYHTSDMFWEQVDRELKTINIPVVCVGYDPSYWVNSNVEPEIVTNSQAYITYGGEENFQNLLYFINNRLFSEKIRYLPPVELPWEGIYHPDSENVFTSLEEYLSWYSSKKKESLWAGILLSRVSWSSENLEIENKIIRSLEAEGLNVIPVFSYSIRDDSLGARGMMESIKEFMMKEGSPCVDAIIKLVPFLLGSSANEDYRGKKTVNSGIDLLKKLNIPIFHPIISSYMTIEQWMASKGLTLDTGWAVAMPEFEGVIEPIYLGASRSLEDGEKPRDAVPERCEKITKRVRKWIELAQRPVAERKVSFIFNNYPCASVEANVGAATHLDALESVANILKRMKEAGYCVEPPESGKNMIETFMERKAISEFRWTTVQDIASKGGALMHMDVDTYMDYFSTLPPTVRERVNETWGEPPGQGMVLDNKILITGISYGNATVHVQPKRGCYGSRCDGQVCKILHDPECPPTHQYLATYYWFESIFCADVIVQVGTHGNLEFLPGKGLGLSQECFPDIAIGNIPCLYIYNSDNPPEGTIAKRRGYATLVDHMQTVLSQSGLYDELEEIETLLNHYETAKHDPARAHALHHLIVDAVAAANLDKDMHLSPDEPLEDIVRKAHEALSTIRNTQINIGMHIIGEVPEGEKRIDFINSIIRFDSGDSSVRRIIARIMGHDLVDLLENQDKYSEKDGASYGAILENLEKITKSFIHEVLEGSEDYESVFMRSISTEEKESLGPICKRILDISRRIDDSKEIESLLNGFEGGYIPAGPSGLIARGHEDVLPTGRNFYSLDPYSVPTRAAWRVGQRMAEILLQKYEAEEGEIPENVALYWMAGDIMSAEGELFAQMLTLIGVEPVWQSNGQVKSFSIVPIEKLGRPRIDITVRTSGILRDNLSNCYELLDEAIQMVAALDEPPDKNFVRKHAHESMEVNNSSWRDATLRIFSSSPGTYGNGVNLAVYASAWKEESDLVDTYVAWNGFAYGKDIAGQQAHEQLASSLSTVSVTFNKVQSDEYDLLSCCCYFGTHGGMTAAARHFSTNEVKPYYGDTSEPEKIDVRDLADEIRRIVRTKLLNPKWIDGMKEHGYKGASDIMKRVTRVYGWEASTQEVDDWIFDDITETFVNDDEMRQFFEENNPYALEEIARRLLEAEQRGLWEADEEVLRDLKNNYLEIESWMEDQMGEGECQGGNVDIYTQNEIPEWGDSIRDIMKKVHEKHPR